MRISDDFDSIQAIRKKAQRYIEDLGKPDVKITQFEELL
jgi:hypothetical protein